MIKYTHNDLSQTIDAMRIPMTILVICIHFNIICYPLVSHGEIVQYDIAWVQYPITFFSEVIGRLAVPFFFFTSGYFFFLKDNSFTKEQYVKKQKKRFYSLFVPYVAWWIIAGILTLILSKARLVGELSITSFLYGLWCNHSGDLFMSTSISTPLDGPLWFLRDLMVSMVLSPIFYHLVKKKNIGFLILLCVSLLYILFGAFNLPQYFVPGLSFPCLLFFGWGTYFGFHKINFLNTFYQFRALIVPVAVILMVADLCTSCYVEPLTWSTHLEQNDAIHNAMILFCVPALFLLGASCQYKMKLSKKLSSSSFTIFALHKIIILPLGSVLIHVLHTNSEIYPLTSLAYYFGIILLAFIIGVVADKIISRNNMAKKILTGGR